MAKPPFKMILETDIEKWRYDTWDTKEPETIAWIDDMQPGEVLYDVGANIGIYTLYAASRGVRVVAFEPVLENYVRLVQNIELNGFNNVYPIYGGCGKKSGFDRVMISNYEIGSSGAQVGQEGRLIPVYALDDINNAEERYIKIDVDGLELDILFGARSLTDNGKVKSLLVEFNEYLAWIKHYTTDNKYNTMTPHSRERRHREGIKAENVVFTRL